MDDILVESALKRQVNTHSTHIEELMFDNGYHGIEQAIEGLEYIINVIKTNDGVISTKIDGCVDKDTKVVTTHGPKPISHLTNDDYVMTYDIANDKFVYQSNVLPRITGNTKQWVDVVLSTHHKVRCTVDHQWLTVNNKWIQAQNLRGKLVRSADNSHRAIRVVDVKPVEGKHDQWDITTHHHNFVVDCDGDRVIIHNSPAVMIIDGDKGIGVATKSFFNVNPKVNYTVDDIKRNHSGKIADILTLLLQYAPKIVKRNRRTIYQADMLFTDDKKRYSIDHSQLIGFQPNTILYTVDANSEIGKAIDRAKLGFAVHTEYQWDGSNPSSAKVSKYAITKDVFKDSDDVFVIDTVSNHKRVDLTFDHDYTKQFNQIRSLAKSIDWSIYQDDFVRMIIKGFINSYFRTSAELPSPSDAPKALIDSINKRIETQRSERKTTKGKDAVNARYSKFQTFASDQGKRDFESTIKIFNIFTTIKKEIIQYLDKLSTFTNFVIDRNGNMVATGEEGYFLSQTSAKGVKIVDRYTFARNNYSKDIIRSWTHQDEKR